MSDHRTRRRRYAMIIWTSFCLIFVVGITMMSIRKAMPSPFQRDLDASPWGYTTSLSMVVVPFLLLIFWYIRYPNRQKKHWPALLKSIGSVAVIWCALDVIAAPSIFQFPNCKATMQCYLPGWLPGHGFSGAFPIEEVIFYLFACFLMLMLYIASCELWFADQGPPESDFEQKALDAMPLLSFPPRAFWWSAFLILAAIVYKYSWAVPHSNPVPIDAACNVNICFPGHTLPQPPEYAGVGFPIYFVVLVLIVLLPTMLLYDKLHAFVNTRALQFTVLVTVIISIVWEVTLALPYGWWEYNHHWMVGLHVRAWFFLPIESVILWFAASWGMVFNYEVFRIGQVTERGFFTVLLKGAARSG